MQVGSLCRLRLHEKCQPEHIMTGHRAICKSVVTQTFYYLLILALLCQLDSLVKTAVKLNACVNVLKVHSCLAKIPGYTPDERKVLSGLNPIRGISRCPFRLYASQPQLSCDGSELRLVSMQLTRAFSVIIFSTANAKFCSFVKSDRSARFVQLHQPN